MNINIDMIEAMKLYKNDLEGKGKSKLTVKNYVNDIKIYNVWLNTEGHLPPQTGTTPLEMAAKVSAIYAQQIRDSRDIAPSTANRRIIALRGFLAFISEKGYVSSDSIPQAGLKTKKIQGGLQASVKWLNEEDVKKIFETIENQPKVSEVTRLRNNTIITVLVNTGIRVGEICDLRIGDIDLENGALTVRDGKGGKFREVPLGNKTIGLIKLWLECRDEYTDDSFLFTTERADHITERAVQHLTKRLSALSGIEFSPHTLRHTYCKRIADNTGQIQVVADLAGHSNINTTRIYVKPGKEELKKYVNDVEL